MVRLFVILMVWLFAVNANAGEPKNVWVLHSYHQGWTWTDRITEGIQSVFEPFGKDISLYYDYLDLHRANEAVVADLIVYFKTKLSRIPIDVIIVSDDGALQFIATHGPQLAPAIPIVFCGINNRDALPPTGQLRATGMAEQIDHAATFALMLRLHPNCRRVVVIVDRRGMQPVLLDELENSLAGLKERALVEVWNDVDWERLPANLVALTPNDLVYLFAFDHDRRGNVAHAKEVIDMVVRWSPVAVYSPVDFYFGKGIVGGAINSAHHQGIQAGRTALRILSGEAVEGMATDIGLSRQLRVDGRALHRFGIKSGQLPENTEIVFPQPVFWVRHGIYSIGLVALLLVFSGMLLVMVLRQRRKQSNLLQINTDLDGRIREKSIHLQIVNQKLKKQSMTDGVTGIPNRRYIYQRLVEEVKKARRYNMPLAIVLFDIDGFKKIYDERGYVLGESVLRDVGRCIKRNMREIDLVGRYGGEAFLVILPNTSAAQGQLMAERIREKVAALSWEQGEVKVTLSGGLTFFNDETPPELVQRADDLLAAVKRSGGNRIAVARGAGGQGGEVILLPDHHR
ncbi:GGDEF domain-containing protein [Desulfatitalea tepidiphila]|uniref:GGDEF domain-containing protein n=1 Tax=Desulfatitalea tepidiphila TaxID=1185843 RepID=UPI0006B5A2FA|nr:GGDEF domain-containing protein [Desulfatitalea tepidiphila]